MIVASDVRNMTAVMNETLLNNELVALHQNTSTPPGKLLGQWLCDEPGHCNIWGRRLDTVGNDWLVALTNTGTKSHSIGVKWSQLGWTNPATPARVRDLWKHTDVASSATKQYKVDAVPAHGTAVLRLTATSS